MKISRKKRVEREEINMSHLFELHLNKVLLSL